MAQIGIEEFSQRMYRRSGTEGLPAHLERVWGIQVDKATELDLGVSRVDRRDGPSWVARLFPRVRPIECVRGYAEILHFLESQDLPAERCANPSPVSTQEARASS